MIAVCFIFLLIVPSASLSLTVPLPTELIVYIVNFWQKVIAIIEALKKFKWHDWFPSQLSKKFRRHLALTPRHFHFIHHIIVRRIQILHQTWVMACRTKTKSALHCCCCCCLNNRPSTHTHLISNTCIFESARQTNKKAITEHS